MAINITHLLRLKIPTLISTLNSPRAVTPEF
jgi:hypothetical protein